MNSLVILLIAAVALLCGYVFYGGWLAKTWGIDPKKKTPAVEIKALSRVPSWRPCSDGCPFSSGF